MFDYLTDLRKDVTRVTSCCFAMPNGKQKLQGKLNSSFNVVRLTWKTQLNPFFPTPDGREILVTFFQTDVCKYKSDHASGTNVYTNLYWSIAI